MSYIYHAEKDSN